MGRNRERLPQVTGGNCCPSRAVVPCVFPLELYCDPSKNWDKLTTIKAKSHALPRKCTCGHWGLWLDNAGLPWGHTGL